MLRGCEEIVASGPQRGEAGAFAATGMYVVAHEDSENEVSVEANLSEAKVKRSGRNQHRPMPNEPAPARAVDLFTASQCVMRVALSCRALLSCSFSTLASASLAI